jgi:hypothetical protein
LEVLRPFLKDIGRRRQRKRMDNFTGSKKFIKSLPISDKVLNEVLSFIVIGCDYNRCGLFWLQPKIFSKDIMTKILNYLRISVLKKIKID